MDTERIRELLDAYGADERRWPAEDRAAHGRIATEEAAWLAEARALDDALASYEVPPLDLAQRVLDALPVPLLDRVLTWLVPHEARHLWRPALAAALPMVLGIAIGIAGPDGMSEYEAWAAAERDLLAAGAEEGTWYE